MNEIPSDEVIESKPSCSLEIDENSYSSLPASIIELANALCDLNRQAVREYAPVVNCILQSRSQHTWLIEHTLDGLLGFCGYQPALLLYKKLCRHYFEIDPAATVAYINAYREYWDSELADANPPSFEESSR